MSSGDPIGSNRLAAASANPVPGVGTGIVSRAASILAQEAWPAAARVLAASLGPQIASAPLSGLASAPLSGPASAPLSGPTGGGLHLFPALEAPADVDRLRRQAHDLIETFLAALSPRGPAPDDRVPLLRAAAAVSAGSEARVTVKVVNEEDAPSSVSLYSTNLVADAGYDIPSVARHVFAAERHDSPARRGRVRSEDRRPGAGSRPASIRGWSRRPAPST